VSDGKANGHSLRSVKSHASQYYKELVESVPISSGAKKEPSTPDRGVGAWTAEKICYRVVVTAPRLISHTAISPPAVLHCSARHVALSLRPRASLREHSAVLGKRGTARRGYAVQPAAGRHVASLIIISTLLVPGEHAGSGIIRPALPVASLPVTSLLVASLRITALALEVAPLIVSALIISIVSIGNIRISIAVIPIRCGLTATLIVGSVGLVVPVPMIGPIAVAAIVRAGPERRCRG